MKTGFQKITSLLLALVMLGSLLPMTAFAAGDEGGELPAAPAESPLVLAEEPAELPAATETPAETAAPTESPAAPEETVAPTETPVEPEETVLPAETPAVPTETAAPTEAPAETAAPAETETPAAPVVSAPEASAADAEVPQLTAAQILGARQTAGPRESTDPRAEDGAAPDDLAETVTVKYYAADGKTVLGEESVVKGGMPVAATPIYVVEEKFDEEGEPYGDRRLIVGWTKEKIDWSQPNSEFTQWSRDEEWVMFPMYNTVEADTNYYAVYAPDPALFGNAYSFVCYYLDDPDSDGWCLMTWDFVKTTDPATAKPQAAGRPAHLIYNLLLSNNELGALYLNIRWYNNEDLGGEAMDPVTQTINQDTVFYGVTGDRENYHLVGLFDAQGELLQIVPVEDGYTLGEYPGELELPAGKKRWEDLSGKLYDLEGEGGLLEQPITEDTAFGVFEGYHLNYYSQDGETLLKEELVPEGEMSRPGLGLHILEGGENKIIVGWTEELLSAEELESLWTLKPAAEILFPGTFECTAHTDYYAVYAPDDMIFAVYYDNLGYVMGHEIIPEAGGKPQNAPPRLVLPYSPNQGATVFPQYRERSWQLPDDPNWNTPLDPRTVSLTESTVFVASLDKDNGLWDTFLFYDADGRVTNVYLVLRNSNLTKTLEGYPEGQNQAPRLPEGYNRWQDSKGTVYTQEEIMALSPVDLETHHLRPVSKEVTVEYYLKTSEGFEKADPETVAAGEALKEVPELHRDLLDDFGEWIEYDHPYTWYDNEDLEGEPIDMSKERPQEDTKYYAAPIKAYTISFYDFDGEFDGSRIVYEGEKIHQVAKLLIDHGTNDYTDYTFPAGWILGSAEGEPVADIYALTIDQDMKFYPVALEDSYAVEYYLSDRPEHSVPEGKEMVLPGGHPRYVPKEYVDHDSESWPPPSVAINYWMDEDGDILEPAEIKALTINKAAKFYVAEGHSITYLDADGETVLGKEVVMSGDKPTQIPAENESGETITNWLNAAGSFIVLEKLEVEEDIVLTAWYSPGLNDEDHVKYINGKGNGQFDPLGALSRAEAAQIVYSLMVDKSMGPYAAGFTDVPQTEWYYKPIMTLASHNILLGNPDGSFNPNGAVTRAQFVAILCRLFPMESGNSTFADVTTQWYADVVASAADRGWVLGSEDTVTGKMNFRPGDSIRRVEAVAIMNRVLGRVADKAAIEATERMIFRDVRTSHWGFLDVMEASIGHEYTASGSGETWKSGFTMPATGMAKGGIRNITGETVLYFTDENGLLVRRPAGIHALKDSSGVTRVYYFPEDGCRILKEKTPGIYDLDTNTADDTPGKLYYIQNNFAIRHFQYQSGYETPVFEYNKNMYWMQTDHSLLRDDYAGNLYFGKNGAYTTGDAELDTLVYNFMGNFITANMTQQQKLSALYVYLRDGRDSNEEMLFGYHNWQFDKTLVGEDWNDNNCAKRMLKTGLGDCYHWAAMATILYRRLGYDAYRVIGQLGRYSTGQYTPHAWEVINYPDGTRRMYDVQLEWGWIHGWYDVNKHYNLFGMSYQKNQSIGMYKW